MTQYNLQEGIVAPLVIALVVLAVVVGGVAYYVANQPADQDAMMEEDEMMKDGDAESMMEDKDADAMIEGGDEMMKDGDAESTMEEEGGAMMEDEDAESMMEEVSYAGEVLAGSTTPLLDFVKSDYEKALASKEVVLLYFYADWCPICKAEIPHLYGAFDDLNTDRLVGFQVNYKDDYTDNDEEDLARQFGVAYQHTKVFLKNGQRILKSPESWSKDRYLDEINTALNQ